MSEQRIGGGRAETVMAFAVLGILALLVVPVSAGVLDGLLAVSIGIAVLMLLISLGLNRALEFSVFPSLLLVVTLFRLALNVATTRLILRGAEGPGAAGHVIEAFGRFVVGGSLVVGMVIFLILIVVQVRGHHQGLGPRVARSPPGSPSTPCPASRWPSTPTSTPA